VLIVDCTGGFSPKGKATGGMKLTTHLFSVLVKNGGTISLLPLRLKV
jgi:hypothetical protein